MPFPSLVRLPAIVGELRRRRVTRVAVVYLVAAWGVIEVSETILPHIGAPPWAVTAVILLAALGLPVALVLAWHFDLTPEGVARAVAREAAAHRAPASLRRRLLRGSLVAVGVAAPLALGAWYVAERSRGPALDDGIVAVLPFRVSGADEGVHYLAEGLPDLLEAKLTGTYGPRAVDMRAVLNAWRRTTGGGDPGEDDARRVARELGAGQAVIGSVVGNSERLVVTVSLVDATSRQPSRHATVESNAADLISLVDRLATALLLSEAGEIEERLEDLASRSLPAVLSYLEGRALHREGQYTGASLAFETAVRMDTTFVLAALGLRMSAQWTGASTPAQIALANDVFARHGHRLTARDRALYQTYLPAPIPEKLRNDRRAVDLAPERVEAWYHLGDRLYHDGPLVGLGDHLERAGQAFERALALDSSFMPALEHLIDVEAGLRRTDHLRRTADVYFGRSHHSELIDFYEWRVATALGDSAALADIRASFDVASAASLWRIAGTAMLIGDGLDDAAHAIRAAQRPDAAPADHSRATVMRAMLSYNRGAIRHGNESLATTTDGEQVWAVSAAVFDHGRPELARAHFEHVLSMARRPAPADPGLRVEHARAACMVALWLGAFGPGDQASSWANLLRDQLADVGPSLAEQCASGADVLRTVRTDPHSSEARDAIERLAALEATHADYAAAFTGPLYFILLPRALAAAGEPARGLAYARRYVYGWAANYHRASRLLLEAQLSAETGDDERAARAYRAYLDLRDRPDPELTAQVESARTELARLVTDR